jgi:hypothetical protein
LKGGGMFFLFRSEFVFRTTQELEYLFFFRLFFFPPPKSEYFFHQHWESEYFLRKKP